MEEDKRSTSKERQVGLRDRFLDLADRYIKLRMRFLIAIGREKKPDKDRR